MIKRTLREVHITCANRGINEESGGLEIQRGGVGICEETMGCHPHDCMGKQRYNFFASF